MSEFGGETAYLKTLLQLGQTLNISLDLSQVLHVAIEQVVPFVRAERGFILLVDEKTNRLGGKAVHNFDPTALEAALTGRDKTNRVQISRTIVEQTLKERRAVLSNNAMEDPRFANHTSVQLAHLRSVLAVPLVAQGHLLGLIYLDNRIQTGVFDEHHAEMLAAFANQAAVAIENARLYENLRRSMEERLRLQQELHEKETQRRTLQETNSLLSDYIGYVAHELRNPLTTIRGCVQTLAEMLHSTQHDKKGGSRHAEHSGESRCSDNAASLESTTRAEFYEIIEAESDRMLNLINELLDSARLEAGRPLALDARPLKIGPLLEKLARLSRLHRFWTDKHRLTLDIAPDLPEIEADADKVHQILTNLLNNAIKYSPGGGTITVTARPENEGVRITVQDEGVGMNEEQQARLFGRYERLERDDIKRLPGTGLGLYLTRHLVELHGGTISCESEPGRGSTFTVFLP